jgi:LmbE family N-acetylglucosaminyl deacetylase
LIRTAGADSVLTHAYEGGHPDHDACAFAVHAAIRRLNGPAIFEFASYHAGPDGIRTAAFLDEDSTVTTVNLGAAAEAAKQRAFACFKTQQDTLSLFRTDVECFRPAPGYDFRSSPHSGALYYEGFDWGITGAQFREQAALAIRHLGIREQRF